MCGIFAYIGKKTNAGDLTLSALKTLEYRGYDSWGVAAKSADGSVIITKHIGKIGSAEIPHIVSSLAIGHTRWATHGGVTEKNAHPHANADRSVIVVHNGIVENFTMLKEDLIKKGYQFISETDTEVIPHQVDAFMKEGKSAKEAFTETMSLLQGMNAVIVLFPKTNEFFVYKNGSPLVFGQTNDEAMIASDAAALVTYTKQVYFFEDGEMMWVNNNHVTLWGANGKEKSPTFITLPYSAQAISLGTFPHFMLKEIHEQPLVLQSMVDTQQETIQKLAEVIRKSYGTYLIGCGSASYAGLAGTYLFSKIAKRHINTTIASEFSYLEDFLKPTSLVIALSQSGETIDILSSLKKTKEKGAKIMAVTNALGSSVYRMADYRFLLQAGPEIGVASTKAFTAKIAWLFLTAHSLQNDYNQGKKSLLKAIAEVTRLVKAENMFKKLSIILEKSKHMFVIGRGVSYAAALEAALKIKEVSYTHAEAFAGGELKHGPIALIEKGTPVIIFNPHDETYDDSLSSAYEVKARGAFVIGVADTNHSVYDYFIQVNNCADATIIPSVVISQLIGYYLAVQHGLDPDKPRNLAKSVTVK